ncbi:MAG: hypothetical protein K6F29_00645 [Bacteroidales bacterium]|nr:hypothetical protein [Bacteroidales bacterium]
MMLKRKIQNKLTDFVNKVKSNHPVLTTIPSAGKVGLFFSFNTLQQWQEQAAIVKNWENGMLEKCTIFCYINSYKVNDTLKMSSSNVCLISKKDFSFMGDISKQILPKLNQPFDLLIDMSANVDEHVLLLQASTPAKLRVGRNPQQAMYYDMVVSVDDSQPIAFYLTQVEKYLTQLAK